MPSWLLSIPNLTLRASDAKYLKYAFTYLEKLFAIIAPLQFTNGGPVIAIQVENEYGNTWNHDPDYLRALAMVCFSGTYLTYKKYQF